MNKTQLIDSISEKAELPKAVAARALEAALESIITTLQDGDLVLLMGFGTFDVNDRAARECRNPRTGEIIKINKTKVVRFKPSKALKEAVKDSVKS